MIEKQQIHICFSESLTDEDQIFLVMTVSPPYELVVDKKPINVYDFSQSQPIDATKQDMPGWQYSFGVDFETILVIVFAPLPAIFLKTIIEESAKDFWVGIKALLKRIGDRKKGVPLHSVQIQLALEVYKGVPIDATITCLNAKYLGEETWTSMMHQCLSEIKPALSAARSYIEAESSVKGKHDKMEGKRIVIHALIEGVVSPEWHIAIASR